MALYWKILKLFWKLAGRSVTMNNLIINLNIDFLKLILNFEIN